MWTSAVDVDICCEKSHACASPPVSVRQGTRLVCNTPARSHPVALANLFICSRILLVFLSKCDAGAEGGDGLGAGAPSVGCCGGVFGSGEEGGSEEGGGGERKAEEGGQRGGEEEDSGCRGGGGAGGGVGGRGGGGRRCGERGRERREERERRAGGGADGSEREGSIPAIVLRARYAISGTEIGSAGTRYGR
eukprot:3030747-Rhodomonas_salina.1